jgi:two-component system, NarL family, response regulator LiaR
MSNSIRVLIVDDHKVVRGGLKAFLQSYDELELVGEARNGEEALLKCDEVKPDVVLMDIVMPRMDGPTATRAIRDAYPAIQVIALTSFPEDDLVEHALQAGAIGYLLKTVEPDELADAIHAAHRGQSTLAPEAAQALIRAHTCPPKLGHDLTEREREVLGLLVKGLTNQEIAQRLTVSAHTAKFHVSNVLSKLGAASRTEAVALALENHLVDP